MAKRVPNDDEPQRPRAQWQHDWHPYEDYKTVHTEHLKGLIASGKILHSGLSFIETAAGNELISVNIRGYVECAAGVVIMVDKWLDVRRGRNRRYEVQGSSYSYHA